MPARPYILNELTWKTVRDTRYEVAVLPWGATEAHNFHLPYATDTIQCEAIAAQAAQRAWEANTRIVVLPESRGARRAGSPSRSRRVRACSPARHRGVAAISPCRRRSGR